MTAVEAIQFAPLLPFWALAALAVGGAALLVLSLVRLPRHAPVRGLIAVVLAAILLNPVHDREEREAVDDIGLILVDESGSMTSPGRQAQLQTALASLQEAEDGIEWNVQRVAGDDQDGSQLGAALAAAVSQAETSRLGGVFYISDGIATDTPSPSALPADVPLHHLVAGERDTNDRRLVVESVPPFTIAGENASITVRVDDSEPEPLALTIETSSGFRDEVRAPPGEPLTVTVPVERRGALDVALSIPVRGGEATAVNNRALASLRGVTERLSVLLVSGRPYPGGRVWRDLFKADPNIDLVHFTILRLPSSFDVTPPQDLSLIPFPVEELFEERLGDFDLIIFDRFDLTSLMAPAYFYSLADRVQNGGGLLVVAGPEYGARNSLALTALRPILPAEPNGADSGDAFQPERTKLGARHPVTRTLADPAGWGAWGSHARLRVVGGDTLMRTPGGDPLLILDRVGDGRVGMIGSADIWWWSRHVQGAGPHADMLRRVSHWLMQEPDLEEEQLRVTGGADTLTIESDSVLPVTQASVTGPDDQMRIVEIPEGGTLTLPAPETGLHDVRAGERRRFALVGNAAEFSDMQPAEAALAPTVDASGGGTFWLEDGMPSIRRVEAGASAFGGSWAGVVRRNAGALIAVDRTPLIPPVVALILLAGLLGLAWWRERK
ncbi:MAG: hypothetical protein V2J26_04745 [Pacificimonas sp.]|jgi:hypothetical protein|nr:hypothetical protein [Pacificimonas sp.]